MATSRKGTRKCQRCGLNRQLSAFTPKGRICQTCRKTKTYATTKNARLQETYGISYDEWEQLLRLQGGVCALCKGKRPQYDTDHDHKMEKALVASGLDPLAAARMSVRGLLCKRCNRRLLPASLDSVEILSAAILYLDSPPAQTILTGLPWPS